MKLNEIKEDYFKTMIIKAFEDGDRNIFDAPNEFLYNGADEASKDMVKIDNAKQLKMIDVVTQPSQYKLLDKIISKLDPSNFELIYDAGTDVTEKTWRIKFHDVILYKSEINDSIHDESEGLYIINIEYLK